jgi:hypothetical protein
MQIPDSELLRQEGSAPTDFSRRHGGFSRDTVEVSAQNAAKSVGSFRARRPAIDPFTF